MGYALLDPHDLVVTALQHQEGCSEVLSDFHPCWFLQFVPNHL